MLNHVTLLGRLAQTPELKTTQSGRAVTSFDLAVPVPSKDQNTPPDYIPIVCWEKQAEFATRFLSKGRQIAVEGRISTRKWTDNDGKNRKAVEVIASRLYFADSNNGGAEKPETTPGTTPPTQAGTYNPYGSVPQSQFEELGNEEELPF